MTNKGKAFLGLLALAAFIGAASLAYPYLSDRLGPPDMLGAAPSAPTVTQAEAEANQERSSVRDDGIAAIDFGVLDAEGNEVRLSDYIGKPIVLNFWASWCPPCKSEMPEFDHVYQEMGADVLFMMVDLVDGQRETVETGAAYVREQGFSFPVFYDTKGEAGYAYGVSSIPTTIFIDSEGWIITGARGAIDEDTLRRGIDYIFAP